MFRRLTRGARRRTRALLAVLGIAVAAVTLGVPPAVRAEAPAHLVIAEIATGGASGSDEFVELLNPTAAPLPIANLEMAYVTASGATVTRRAAWPADSPAVPPGGRILIANEAGAHAVVADVRYAGGIADSGGTLVLRPASGGAVIDAVAWGAATGAFVEGLPAAAPPAGSSLQRRVGADGSVQDTDNNAADLVVGMPTPQGATAATASDPPAPTATPSTPSPVPATPSAAPSIATTVAVARSMANGTRVTIEGIALTGSTFHDGGGFVADGSGGVAVIAPGAPFVAGSRLAISGEVDDRFAQRTIRADAVHVLGGGPDPVPLPVQTGLVAEQHEGRLVRVAGAIRAAPTELTAGLAFEVDDGTGAARIVVGSATAIPTASWIVGATVDLVGVVGQRDSSGSGGSGYRVYPRSVSDVLDVTPPAAATSTPSASASPVPSPAASASPPVLIAIGDARGAPAGSRVSVRGTVTLPPGVVDDDVGVIQDGTGAIVVRIDPGGPTPALGDTVEVHGVRSTRAGMETIRADGAPQVVGSGSVTALRLAARDATERVEARLVVVTGTLPASARRAASGTVSFDLDDGTGVLRVVIASPLKADDELLVAGATVTVVGVLGQETTGAEPNAGYRLWPRSTADVTVDGVIGAADAGARTPPAGAAVVGGGAVRGAGGAVATLHSLDAVGTEHLVVGATLVAGPWPELGVGGLLWDGRVLVAIAAESTAALAVVENARPPISVVLRGLRAAGTEPVTGARLVALGTEDGAVAAADAAVAIPRRDVPIDGGPPAWVTLIGRLTADGGALVLEVGDDRVAITMLCDSTSPPPTGAVLAVSGVGLGGPPRIIVPCDGLRFAPALARRPAADPGPATDGAPPSVVTYDPDAAASHDQRRPLAAWLLAFGTLALGGGVAAWRRFALAGSSEPLPDAAPDGRGADAPAAEHLAAPTRPLTLLRLRRERGP